MTAETKVLNAARLAQYDIEARRTVTTIDEPPNLTRLVRRMDGDRLDVLYREDSAAPTDAPESRWQVADYDDYGPDCMTWAEALSGAVALFAIDPTPLAMVRNEDAP